jgi:alkanesulfonate monooxygenase SsuD/methylene tetrahydromethanopterin reductase-like flavin-dependent oxidoreductase (luciferase family)
LEVTCDVEHAHGFQELALLVVLDVNFSRRRLYRELSRNSWRNKSFFDGGRDQPDIPPSARGMAIVGSPGTVAGTLEAYQKAEVEIFILSGMPQLEEAYRFGEKVLPRLDVSRDISQARHFTWSMVFDLSTVRRVKD